MGILRKKTPREPQRLPTGTFTVDAQGHVVSSTVPQAVPPEVVQEIGEAVVSVFQGAQSQRGVFRNDRPICHL